MPSKSEKQRTLMCIAYQIKTGKTPRSYSKEAAKVADQMTEKQLEEYCKEPIEKGR